MGRVAGLACVVVLTGACAVGSPSNPFGSEVTGAPESEEGEVSSTTDATDSLNTISESLESTAGVTTSGVVSDTDPSSTSTGQGSESGLDTSSSSSSSSGDASSSSTGAQEIGMCATSNSLTACATAGSNSQPFTEDMLCTTDMTYINPEVYDFYVVDVAAGDCVHVTADNEGGDADVMAYVVDLDEAYYGLEADYSELDDEIACTTLPFNGYACPSAGVTASSAGPITIAIGQWGLTPDCTDNNPYTLWVAVDGVDVDLSEALVYDDYEVDPLMCP